MCTVDTIVTFVKKSTLAKESWAIMRGVMVLVPPSQSTVKSLALMLCCFVMVILFFVCFVIFADMREYGFIFLWCRCAARLLYNRISTLSHGNLENNQTQVTVTKERLREWAWKAQKKLLMIRTTESKECIKLPSTLTTRLRDIPFSLSFSRTHPPTCPPSGKNSFVPARVWGFLYSTLCRVEQPQATHPTVCALWR